MAFFEHIKAGDKVKWLDSAWRDYGEDALEVLNLVRTVTEVNRDGHVNETDTIIVLDGDTEVLAIECVCPETVFSLHDGNLTITK